MKFILLAVLLITPVSPTFIYNKPSLCLLPTVAFRDRSTSSDWIVYNQGWYYQQSPVQSSQLWNPFSWLLGTILDLNRLLICISAVPTYQSLCFNGLGQSTCARSDENGCIRNNFRLTDQQMQPYRQPGGSGNRCSLPASISSQNLQTTSDVHLTDHSGYTVITDIDDTIKVTGVTSAAQIRSNTVSGSFTAILGMASIYLKWQAQYSASFAYISAAPDQSYPCLKEFFGSAKFPMGSAHMRHYTSKDSDWSSFFMSPDYVVTKKQTILQFLQNTLYRKFILVDNIFQTDLSLYVDIFKQYPDRIGKICIRKYASDDAGQRRLDTLFQDIPRDKWMTFETGDDLPRNIC